MSALAPILMAAIGAACVLVFIRLIRGPNLADRVVALDLIYLAGVALAGIYSIYYDDTVFLDVAIVIAVIGFVGTVGFAAYLEHTGRRREE